MIKKFLFISIVSSMIFVLGACKPQTTSTSPEPTDIYLFYDEQGLIGQQ